MLIVADPPRIGALVGALDEPLPQGPITVLVSSGGDDTIDLFEARRPQVVLITATLEAGDSKSLIDALREIVPRAEVGIVLIGDDEGPIRTALEARELEPDRFVPGPPAANAVRLAVGGLVEAVALVRGVTLSGPAPETPVTQADADPAVTRAALRSRWAALADSFVITEEPSESSGDEATPLPPPIHIKPRIGDLPVDAGVASAQAWRPGTTAELSEPPPRAPWGAPAPLREPTLVLPDPEPGTPAPPPAAAPPVPLAALATDSSVDSWAGTRPLAELLDSEPRRSTELHELAPPPDAFDDELLRDPDPLPPPRAPQIAAGSEVPAADPGQPPSAPDGRDFARQLRAKMSMMAQRLFQGAEASAATPVELGPRHDHHTEIDLASVGEEIELDRGVTEIEPRAAGRASEARELTTAPGSWDTQIRERGLPDTGEVVRGLSDAAMLLAKMFAQGSTGRVGFRRGDVEKVIHFDQGRPVFASSNEPRDRMGELLVREGKITASQYERCQTVRAESGRRMGEILVDIGYLKRRELLPAVRRHVEDIVYSLFGWDRGTYHVALDDTPCAERIRLSRHPAAMILEGIRRKHDRTTLERVVGPPSTVIDVPDRERLGGIINLSDLAAEERDALSAFDGQSDLTTIAQRTGVDVADVLPLAWGLCVLGLATARRMDTEVPDESTALVGETDLAIDRERVRARGQLVNEADYFALLGVRRDATGFEIRRAYQAARRDFAAEGFPNDLRRELAQELDEIAQVLDEAFRVLRDDPLRQLYLANLVE